jgi:hypothetical protein
MTSQQQLEEALANFRGVWALQYPPKGERRRKGTTLDTTALQESWNAYMRANINHHGEYRAVTETNFGVPL